MQNAVWLANWPIKPSSLYCALRLAIWDFVDKQLWSDISLIEENTTTLDRKIQ